MSTEKTKTTDTVEEAKKILAEAEAKRAEAAAMLAEAEKLKTAVEEDKKALAEASAPVIDDGEELVEIKLFKDNKDYKDDLTVGVNGEFVKIQRGKPVRIKKKFARVIEQSNLQDAATAELIEQKENEFKTESEKLNLV